MGLRDSLKQFWNKLRGNNPKLLNSGYNMYYQNTASNANPTNMSFTSYDGYDVEISGINQCQEF